MRLLGMKKRSDTAELAYLDAAKTVYVCPMHPEVVSEAPGVCPKCNMKLDPKPQANEA